MPKSAQNKRFQSTLPRGERLIQDIKKRGIRYISIHAPARGATLASMKTIQQKNDFNPRSREGSDTAGMVDRRSSKRFQSTLPRGERQNLKATYTGDMRFQSTLPRGERPDRRVPSLLRRLFQSTLPRGERRRAGEKTDRRERFQSTLPRGERRTTAIYMDSLISFQSTLPRGERLHVHVPVLSAYEISIHAPARGATIVAIVTAVVSADFNPRSREGSDCTTDPYGPPSSPISIHAPARGATTFDVDRDKINIISIHAPARGATLCVLCIQS